MSKANGFSVALNKTLENASSKQFRTDQKKLLYHLFKSGFYQEQSEYLIVGKGT